MRVAFYAPMKPPDHPVPSGDRRMAALLMQALSLAGHEVELSSRLRSRDGAGDPARQARCPRHLRHRQSQGWDSQPCGSKAYGVSPSLTEIANRSRSSRVTGAMTPLGISRSSRE